MGLFQQPDKDTISRCPTKPYQRFAEPRLTEALADSPIDRAQQASFKSER